MQFTIVLAALATAVVAQGTARPVFEFQNFAASCAADSDQCTFSFNLKGEACTASDKAFPGTDNGVAFKKLPNVGQTACGSFAWSGVRGADGVYSISGRTLGAGGVRGGAAIPASDFTIKDGVEAYTGAGTITLA
ncbi:hypothetical protein HYFRA_00005884 [Hymenoscyphus fraxineus]|uniref:Uncharacterized protein n=1 Tax=Hymenoscyphus fraxineus TaxID=746836 RepID=A0A9N9KVI5_9HELO|nr:hypothetical protein HYFRA_00005884 [Hymenoscyphus fraxineus]